MKKNVHKWINSSVGKIKILHLVVIVTSAIQSALMVAFAVSIKDLINSATKNFELSVVIRHAIISVLLVTLSYAVLILNKILIEKCKVSAEVSIKNNAFRNILKKDYKQISEYRSGDILSRIMGDSAIVARGYAQILPVAVSMITKITLVIAVMVCYQPIFTLILAFGGLAIVGASFLFRKFFKKLHKATREAESNVMTYFDENTNNILAVKVFSAEEKVAKHGTEVLNVYGKSAKRQRYVGAGLSSIIGFAFAFFYIATVVWGAIGLYKGWSGVDFGVITSMIQLVNQLQSPLVNFSAIFSVYYEMVSSAERLMELENLKEENIDVSQEKLKLAASFKSIKCENLCFSYGDERVFVDANFEIKKGDLVLIKGISGIGKSTLLKLILGVYDDYQGKLVLETDGGDMPLDASLRNLFAFVPQGNMLMSGTIGENVKFLSENASDEEIAAAVKVACLDFIYEYKKGLDTEVGENGRGLSEGQGQRVAIARAVLANKPIILLDEATSALDEQTEKQILKNIKNMLGGETTCLFISHKPEAAEICNVTLKIVDGKILTERKN